MFTVKLYRGHTSRYVQAESVEVFPAGPLDGIADDPKYRTNDVREISVVNGNTNEVFYVASSQCWAHTLKGSPGVYNFAYIENEKGSTTEKIYPY